MSQIQISKKHIDRAMEAVAINCFQGLEELNWSTQEGVNAPGYSAEEEKARNVTLAMAQDMGAVSYQDEGGVRYHVFRGDGAIADDAEINDKPATMILSHMDTVPNGGRFDGRAGVVVGLSAAFAVAAHPKAQGTQMSVPLVVAEFPCEESPEFGCFALGSKIATRNVSPEFVVKTKGASDGQTIFTRMNALGMDAAKVCENLTVGHKTLPTEHIGAAFEYHIAQSGGLLREGVNLAPCKDVRGNVRLKTEITFQGEGGHSGAVDMADRASASKAARMFMDRMDNLCDMHRQNGRDLVNTDTYISAGSKETRTTIPEYAECWYEVRSNDDALMEDIMTIMVSTAQYVQDETGVRINLAEQGKDMLVLNKAAQLDGGLAQQFAEFATERGISSAVRSSGAGHDAMILAQEGIPSTIILGAHGNNGISHDPQEILGASPSAKPFSAGEAFYDAVTVLSDIILNGPATSRGKTPDGKSFEQALIERGAKPA